MLGVGCRKEVMLDEGKPAVPKQHQGLGEEVPSGQRPG